MAKAVLSGSDSRLLFWCAGCKEHHGVRVNSPDKSPNWGWNGSVESPTLTPSILVRWGPNMSQVCHSFVTDGKIQYLDDCTHDLAGQTVDLEEFDGPGVERG